MSLGSVIDERIVQMRFDNRDFEKNASESLGTLSKLDQSIAALENSGNGIDLSGLTNAIQSIADRFTTMGIIGMRTLENIADTAYRTGVSLVKSMSVDQVSAGFGKYESITQSVQTIMNATGADLQTTMAALEKLNWFTDETSYNLMDMVSNIARFTNAGVPLDTAITSMIGIADAAGFAGVGVQEASHAMIGFANAISRGAMQSNSWQWIETAHLDGTKLKTVMLEAAVAVGTLQKTSEGAYKTTKGTVVTLGDFKNTLHEGWMTTEVMNKALKEFGGTTEDIYDIYKETGDLASDIIDDMDIAEDDLGLQAFKASQVAKTWTDAINSVKDAVSTGFMTSFQYLIGDFEEASELWTEVAERLYDIFAEPGNQRNEILKLWHDAGGRDVLLEALDVIWQDVAAVIQFIKDIWNEVFGVFGYSQEEIEQACEELGIDINDYVSEPLDNIWLAATKLLTWTKKFRNFVKGLKPSEKTVERFSRVLTGLFSIIDIGRMAFLAIWEIIKAFFPALGDLSGGFLEAIARVGDFFTKLRDSIKESGIFTDKVKILAEWIRNATQSIRDFFGSFAGSGLLEKISGFFTTIKNFFSEHFSNPFKGKGITDFIGMFTGLAVGTGVLGIAGGVRKLVNGITAILEPLTTKLSQMKDAMSANYLLKIAAAVAILALSLALVAAIDSDALIGAVGAISMLFGELMGATKMLSSIGSSFAGLKGLGKAFNTLGKITTSLIKIAASVLILAIAMRVIAGIDKERILSSLGVISVLLLEMVGVAYLFGKMNGLKGTKIGGLILFSIAVAILASVLKSLSGLKWEELGKGIVGISGIMAMLVVFMTLTSKLSNKGKGLGGLIFVSIAISILANIAKSFSKFEWEELGRGLAGIGGIMAMLVVFMGLTSKLSNKGKGLGGLIFVSIAVGILAYIARSFSKFEWEELGRGLAGIGGIMASLVIFMALTSKLSNKGKGLGGLLFVSIAVSILANIASEFAQFEWEELGRGLAGIGGIMAMLAIFMSLTSKLSNKGKGFGGLIFVSIAVGILANIVKSFSELKWEGLAKGLAGVGSIMAMLIIFTAVTSKFSSKGKGFAKLLATALLIGVIGDALSKVAKYNWKQILAAGVAMGGVLLAVFYSMKLASKTGGKLDAMTFAHLGAALISIVVIGWTLAALSKYSWKSMIGAAAAMGLALVSVAASLFIISKTSKGLNGASFIGLAVGVLALIGIGYALGQLSGYDWKTLGGNALVLVGTLVAVSAVLAVLGFIGPAVIAKGVLALAIAVGGVALIIWGLIELGGFILDSAVSFAGKLDVFVTAMQPFMDAVANINEDVTTGASNFMDMMGSVAGATFWTTLASILDKIGDGPGFATNMSTMITNLQPFLSSVTGITADTITSVGYFQSVMSTMASVSFWTTLGSIIDKIGNGPGFAANMSTTITNLQPFLTSVSGITADTIASVGYFQSIMTAMSGISFWATLGSIIDKIGNGPSFATNMSTMITNLQPFLTSVSSVTADTITSVAYFNSMIGTLTNATLWSTIASWISTIGDGPGMATNISTMMTNLDPFITGVTKITNDTLTGAGLFSSLMTTLVGTSFWSSLADFILDMGDPVEFATKISGFMTGMDGFIAGVAKIDQAALDGATNLNTIMGTLTGTGLKTKIGEWVNNWGSDNMTSLGTNLTGFVTNILPFFTSLGAIDETVYGKVDTFLAVVEKVNSGKVFSAFGGQMSTLNEKTKNLDLDRMGQAIGLLTQMASLSTSASEGDAAFPSFNGIDTWLESLATSLSALPNDTMTAFETAGANAAVGFANGLAGNAQIVMAAVTALAESVLLTFQSLLGIHSPSKIFEEFGYFSDMGLVNGLLGSAPMVATATETVAGSVVSPMEEMLNYLSGVLNGDLMVDPTVRPVMDMSNVWAANDQMSSMFDVNRSLSGRMSQSIAAGYHQPSSPESGDTQTPVVDAGYNGTIVNVNVYGAEGQDINELADAVATRLGGVMVRRGVAFG